MDSLNDVKLEPESNSNDAQNLSQNGLQHSKIDFMSFRTNIEQTSQAFRETWLQLNNILNDYKGQILNVENGSLDRPDSEKIMQDLLRVQEENHELRRELDMVNDSYLRDRTESEKMIQELQTQIIEKESEALVTRVNIEKLEKRVKVLENRYKTEKKTRTTRRERLPKRSSCRILPSLNLVETRTPTPTQIARVTPVTPPHAIPSSHSNTVLVRTSVSTQPGYSVATLHRKTEETLPSMSTFTNPPIKVEYEQQDWTMDSESSKNDNEHYMTETQPEHVQIQSLEQKYILNPSSNLHESRLASSIHPVGKPWTTLPHSPSSQSIFICPHCPNSFHSDCDLDQHLRASHRKFTCPKCYEGYSKKYDLMNHIGLVHGKKAKTPGCVA